MLNANDGLDHKPHDGKLDHIAVENSILMKTYCELLLQAPASSFHVLDPEKAKRLKGKTMFIPSPLDVARAIAEIPAGETRTTADLRRLLAEGANAETACPAAINKYWKWIAAANEEADSA